MIENLQKEIKTKMTENKKLETEIARVNKMLMSSYSEKEVVKSLKQEMER